MKKGENKVVVYDRLMLDEGIISRHKTWALAEKAAKRLGCRDRFGLRLEHRDRLDCPEK